MSASITLYRIVDKSEFTSKKVLITEFTDIGVDPYWETLYFDNDGKETFTALHIFGGKKSARVRRDKEMFKKLANTEHNEFGQTLVTKRVDSIYGWTFKRKLFKVKESIYYAYTREEAKRLVKNLFDFEKLAKEYNILNTTDEDAIEEYNYIIETIDKMVEMTGNGYILEIAW